MPMFLTHRGITVDRWQRTTFKQTTMSAAFNALHLT